MSFSVSDGVAALYGVLKENDLQRGGGMTELQLQEEVTRTRIRLGRDFDALKYVTELDRLRVQREREELDRLLAEDKRRRDELTNQIVARLRKSSDVQQHVAVAMAQRELQRGEFAYLFSRDRHKELERIAAANVRRERPWLYVHIPATPTAMAPQASAPKPAPKSRLAEVIDGILAVSPLAMDPQPVGWYGDRADREAAALDRAIGEAYARVGIYGRKPPSGVGQEILRARTIDDRRRLLRAHLAALGATESSVAALTAPPKPTTQADRRESAYYAAYSMYIDRHFCVGKWPSYARSKVVKLDSGAYRVTLHDEKGALIQTYIVDDRGARIED